MLLISCSDIKISKVVQLKSEEFMNGTHSWWERLFDRRIQTGLTLLVGILGLTSAMTARAANYSNINGGSWFDSSIWFPAGYPASGDNVTISNFIVSLTFSNALDLQLNNLNLSNANLHVYNTSGLGTFALAGANSYWTNGGFSGTLLQLGTLTLAGNDGFGNSSTITNRAIIHQTGPGTLRTFLTTLVNTASGTYDLAGDGTIVDYYGGLGGDILVNQGLLRKSAGTNTAPIYIEFVNQGGTIEVDSGTLALADAQGCSNATVNVAAGATLDLSYGAGSYAYWSGYIHGSGSGNVLLRKGNLYGSPSLALNFPECMFIWTSGSLNGSVTNLGTMTLAGTNDD